MGPRLLQRANKPLDFGAEALKGSVLLRHNGRLFRRRDVQLSREKPTALT